MTRTLTEREGHAPVSAHDRILESFEGLLVSDGERAATLDAVASKAGVSKGGLLYHFASKGALIAGLLQRLDALVEDDLERMHAAKEGVVEYFIRTSVTSVDTLQNALERTIVACACLAQGAHPDVREALQKLQNTWLEALIDVVGDPVVARVIMLVGDGLYFNSATRLSDETPTSRSMDDLVSVLNEVVALRASSS